MTKVNKMGNSKNARNRAVAGFTLAEVLIAVAILIVLFAVGIIAGTILIRNTRQSHLDKRAEAVYYAAQSRMMELFVTQEKREEEITTRDGKTVTASVVYDLFHANTFDYDGSDLAYVTSDDSSIVFEDNSLSIEVGGSSAVIEYDPVSLDVYAVILCDNLDKAGTSLGGLTQQGSGAAVRGTAQDRIGAYKGYVGYYAEGKNYVGAKVDGGLQAGAWIVNGRDLLGIVKITVDEETKNLLTDSSTNLKFKLTVRGPKSASGNDETYAEIDISNCEIAWQNYQGAPANNYLDMEGTSSGSDQRYITESGSVSSAWFGDLSGSDGTYGLIGYIKLDSLDKDYHFSDLLTKGTATADSSGEIKPGEDISLSLKVWDSDSDDILSEKTRSASAVSNIENSLFGDFDYVNSLSVAEIVYPRHLQNLDFEYAKATGGAADGAPSSGAKIAAVLAEDIDWAEDLNKYQGQIRNFTPISNDNLGSFTGKCVELDASSSTSLINQLATVAIANADNVTATNPEDVFNGKDPNSTEKYHVIENLRIDTTDTAYPIVGTDRNVGLFGDQKDITIANLVLRSFDIKSTVGTMPTGMLAGKLSGTSAVKNLYVYNKVADATEKGVTGPASCGGVIGEAQNCNIDSVVIKNICVTSEGGAAGALLGKGAGTIKNVLAYNGDDTPEGGDGAATTMEFDDSAYEITGAGATGGLIGEMTSGTVDGCGAALYVRSTGGNAGGLIGTNGATVSKSYSGGHTITVDDKPGIYSKETTGQGRINVQGANAGGLVGASTGAIESSYSTCSAAGSSNTGGLAGTAGSISNCYAVGRVLEGTNPGAIAGSASGITNSYYISLINESYDETTEEFVYLYGTGGATEETSGAIAVDVDEENGAEGVNKYNQFMVDASDFGSETDRVAAPYDKLYLKYGMKTNNDLAGSGSGSSTYYFTKSHYGDWPIPEHIIYNNSGSASNKKRNNNFFVINAMAMSGDNQEVVETSADDSSNSASGSEQTEENTSEAQEETSEQHQEETAEQPQEETTEQPQEETQEQSQEETTGQIQEETTGPQEETTEQPQAEETEQSQAEQNQEETTSESQQSESSNSQNGESTQQQENETSEGRSQATSESQESTTTEQPTANNAQTVEKPEDKEEAKEESGDTKSKEEEALEKEKEKEEKEKKEEEEEEPTAAGEIYSAEELVKLIYGEDAEIPEGAEVQVIELTPEDDEYEGYVNGATDALEMDGEEVASIKVLDIKIIKDGEEIQPKASVNVELNTEQLYGNKEVYSDDEILTVHFNDQNNEAEVLETEVKVNEEDENTEETEEAEVSEDNTAVTEPADTVSFVSDSFSVYVFVQPVKEKVVTASDGNVYDITVTYDNASGIPAGTELAIEEIEKGSDGYDQYVEAGKECLGIEDRLLTYARAFDISFVDQETGDRYQPTKDVNVSIRLLQDDLSQDDENSMISVAHFGEQTEAVDFILEDGAVNFNASGFSVYLVAQTVKEKIVECSDGSSYKVTVTYDGRAGIPGDAELSVREITESDENYSDYVQMSADIQEKDVESFIFARPFDIKLINSETGEVYQPKEGVKVSMELLGTELKDDADLCVVHIPADMTSANIVGFAVNDGSIDFETDGFSVFVYTESTFLRTYRFFTYVSSEDSRYVEYSIYTDAGNTTFTQKIKNNTEELVAPRLPSLEGSSTSTFTGWYVGTDVTSETIEGVTYYTPASLSDTEFDFNNVPEVTETETVYLFSRFADFAYVIFHDQYNGSSQSFPVAQTRRGEKINGTATVEIDDVTVQYDDDTQGGENAAPNYAFYGWSYTPITRPGNTVDDYGNPVSVINTDTIDITQKTDLYPVFQSIFWLTYSSGPVGSGATYIPSKYFYSGDGPTSLTVPVRSGYAFEGWYLDATTNADGIVTSGVRVSDGNGVLNNGVTGTTASVSGGKLMLSNSTKLTANWTESPVQYSLVFWRQKATDQPDLTDANKTYDYAKSITLHANTGATVSVGDEYKHYSTDDFKGFSYNRCDNPVIVKSDGSTVLNVYYDRNVHEFKFKANNSTTTSSTSNDNVVHTVKALYGADINSIWSFTGSNNITYPLTNWNTSWEPENSSSFTGRLTRIAIMPDEDISFHHIITNNTTRYFYYYVEALPGDTDTRTFDGKQFKLYTDLTNDFNKIIYNVDFWELEGFDRYKIGSQNGTDVTNTIIRGGSGGADWNNSWNNRLYFYYLRHEYTIDFYDSYTNSYAYVDGAQLASTNIKYGSSIKEYVPNDPTPVEILSGNTIVEREGCTFKGWFIDKDCHTRVFFEDNDEYRNYSDSKVLYETMSTENIKLYAGWEDIWYLIQIDPNNGTLSSAESTWFWKRYCAELVQEYSDVTRDYVESSSGTYYYINKNRAYYDLPDEWDPSEDNIRERGAYYTDSLDGVKDFTRYKYAQNAYRYAGWYEVDDQGNETLYNFNNPITHNLKLVLHWKRIGTYYVQYNAVVEQGGVTLSGRMDSGDNNEQVFAELDGDDYSDNADVVVTRTAKAPEGYNFVGWKIRGDDSGDVYHPGQSFVMKAKYTVSVGGKDVIYLDAVYTRIATAKIIYDANGGEIDENTVDLGEPTDAEAPTPLRTVDENSKYATIAHLVNNSGIRLANGRGFVLGSAELTGWNTKPDCSGDHYDLNGDYYVDTEEPITLYAEWKVKVYFDKNWPQAGWGGEWNDVDAEGHPIFTYDSELERYYTYIYINNTVPEPSCIPTSPEPDKMFYYWSRERYTEHPAQFIFSTPITDGDVILYAHWGKVKSIPAHAADTSEPTFVKKDEEWLVNGRQTVVDISNNDVMLATAADVAPYVTGVTSEYEFAFTCVSDSLQNCSEDKAISKVWYNINAACIYVTYLNGAERELDSDDEIYFVYFKNPKSLNIGYVWMNTDRSLTPVAVSQSAPVSASVNDSTGSYSVNGNITAPLSYQTNTEYKYYAYAIGGIAATSDAGLKQITRASDSDSARPSFAVKNTWNGFRYSTDGSTWTSVGYEAKLYVVYFESMPSVLTLKEKTIGTQRDMDEKFNYEIKIENNTKKVTQIQTRTRSREWSLWGGWSNWSTWSGYNNVGGSSETSETSESDSESIELKDSEKETISLFYTPENVDRTVTGTTTDSSRTRETETEYSTKTITTISQTIKIVQEKKEDFDVDNKGVEGNSDVEVGTRVDEKTYKYSTDPNDPAGSGSNSLSSPHVTFTNIRKKIKVEVHVAVIDADNDGNTMVVQHDEAMRTDGTETTNNNSFEVEINYPVDGDDHTKLFDAETGILHDLPPITTTDTSGVLRAGFEGYGFAGVAYGLEDVSNHVEIKWPRSNLEGITTLEKITYGKLFEDKDNVYDLYFNENTTYSVDKDFQKPDTVPVYRLYYVYYRVPRVVYVKESEGGVLTRVKGSLDGTTIVDNITYNGSEQTLTSPLNKDSNEGKVAQEQLLPVSTELFTISQSSTEFFNMLPLMDDDTDKLYLTYSMIGIGKRADIEKVTDPDMLEYFEVGTGPSYNPLYLQSVDSQLKYSKDSINWYNFAGEVPTIYAIYKEKGFNLNIAKVLKNCSSNGKEFKIRISSKAIMESSYEVEGTGAATITATPISLDTDGQTVVPGTIDINVKSSGDKGTEGTNGNTVTEEDIQNSGVVIKGLAKGTYTISEILTEGSGSYELTAEAGDKWEDIWEVYGTENDSEKVVRIKKDDVTKITETEGRFLTLPDLDFTEVEIVGEGEDAVASKMVLLANKSDKTRRIILRKEITGTNKPVAGAVFDIHYSDGSLFKENCASGSAGAYFVGDIPYGTFYIHEKSPEGGFYELKIEDKEDGTEHGVVELSTESRGSIEAWRN